MRRVIYLIIVCAGFLSCQKPTQIQITNSRADEKTTNFGFGDYYSDTGRIRDVERIYVEYGEMTDVWIYGYRSVNSDDIVRYDLVDNIFIDRIKANSISNVIELENCDKVEISYFINAYNHYYLANSEKVAVERIQFELVEVADNIKYGKINKITIKD